MYGFRLGDTKGAVVELQVPRVQRLGHRFRVRVESIVLGSEGVLLGDAKGAVVELEVPRDFDVAPVDVGPVLPRRFVPLQEVPLCECALIFRNLKLVKTQPETKLKPQQIRIRIR